MLRLVALLERMERATTARERDEATATFLTLRLLEQWLALAWRIGEEIRLRTPADIAGRFAGVDLEGRLLIDIAGEGMRVIAAGELYPRLDEHAAGAVR